MDASTVKEESLSEEPEHEPSVIDTSMQYQNTEQSVNDDPNETLQQTHNTEQSIVVFGIAAKADAMTNLIIWLITSRQSSWGIMSIAPDRESRERLCSYLLTHHPHQRK